MTLFWAHEGEVVACGYRTAKRSLVNFVVINTSDWSTKTIEVSFNGRPDLFTTGSDVIMHIYICTKGGDQDSRRIVVERVAHMR